MSPRRTPVLPPLDLERLLEKTMDAKGTPPGWARDLAKACVEALRATPHAELVRAALGDDPLQFIQRLHGSNGWDQHRLLRAAADLAGGLKEKPRG